MLAIWPDSDISYVGDTVTDAVCAPTAWRSAGRGARGRTRRDDDVRPLAGHDVQDLERAGRERELVPAARVLDRVSGPAPPRRGSPVGREVRDVMALEGRAEPAQLNPVAAAGGHGEDALRLLRAIVQPTLGSSRIFPPGDGIGSRGFVR